MSQTQASVIPMPKVGDSIEVENGRTEVLYPATVLEVTGTRVKVSMPTLDSRPHVFNLASPEVMFEDSIIFAGW